MLLQYSQSHCDMRGTEESEHAVSPVRVSSTHHSVTIAAQCQGSQKGPERKTHGSSAETNVGDINPESVPRTDPRPSKAPKRVVAYFLKVPSVLPPPGSEFTKPSTTGSP